MALHHRPNSFAIIHMFYGPGISVNTHLGIVLAFNLKGNTSMHLGQLLASSRNVASGASVPGRRCIQYATL